VAFEPKPVAKRIRKTLTTSQPHPAKDTIIPMPAANPRRKELIDDCASIFTFPLSGNMNLPKEQNLSDRTTNGSAKGILTTE
jgi:hypothetical protein